MEDDYDYNPDDYDENGFPKNSPLRCYEVVEILTSDQDTEQEAAELAGKRGAVDSYANNEGNWAYGVAVQNGEGWYLFASRLLSIGVVLTHAELYGPPSGKQEWARINSNGECVAGDPSFLKRGPTPLFVDLEQLVPKI